MRRAGRTSGGDYIIPGKTVLQGDGSEQEFYGLLTRQILLSASELSSLLGGNLADFQGENFYVAIDGEEPIQQRFNSYPSGDRAPWQWLLNGKKAINAEFYYHNSTTAQQHNSTTAQQKLGSTMQ